MAPSKPKKKKAKPTSLSTGRPPTISKPTTTLSSRVTRKVINTHHQLNKAYNKALSSGNDVLAESFLHQINSQGGLTRYQEASKTGQSASRGGDSSTVLVEWLKPLLPSLKSRGETLRLLEVGALSTQNACSRSGMFDVERIDLNAQGEGILQQDFMERPLPRDDHGRRDETFDVLSLSLVVNYVPDPVERGEMLRRCEHFLRRNIGPLAQDPDFVEKPANLLPCVFLVLPAPCVQNSRYLTEARLEDIMQSLGYALVKRKLSAKLVYYLWRFENSPGTTEKGAKAFKKEELRSGATRNNFAIVLR